MKKKRLAAGVLSFILAAGSFMPVYAKQTADETVKTVNSVSANSVSANTVSQNNALKEADIQTGDGLPEEYEQAAQEAADALQEALEEKDVYAIVYLTDSYAVKKEADEDSDTVLSIPMARTVQITGMEVNWQYEEEWEEYVPTVWYKIAVYEGETLYEGYMEEEYLAYSDEVLLEWKSDWSSLFPLSGTMGVADGDSYADVSQFPASYQSALKKLKSAHPNWIFVPMKVNRNWDDCISEQMGNYSWIPSSQPAAYKGNKINSSWNYASKEGLAYYMDPRNFLTESSIFQFEQNTYNASYHTQEALQTFLNNTFMKGSVPGDSQGRTYAKVIFDSGKSRGLSPFNLAARVVQEQGVNGTSPMISGTYPGYEGYYNYYNISASGTTNEAVYKSGLTYAKSKGWNTRVKALEGGAAFIGNGYILQGQDTLYLQKFDVEHGSSSLHQYMQNIMAPFTEGQSMKKMYASAGSLNSAFVFKIPVYNKMPNEYNFSINTKSVTLQRGVSGKDTYTLQVKNNSVLVSEGIEYKSADEKVAKVDKTSGKIEAVGSGTTTITVTVTYGDGDTLTYTCTVKVLSPLQDIHILDADTEQEVEEKTLFLTDGSPEKVAYLDENNKTQYLDAAKGELPATATLEVSYDPADTTDDKKVTWTVKDESVLSLQVQDDQKAVITPKKGGSTTITAKVGTFTKNVEITVRIPMTEAGLNLDEKQITLYKGESTKVTASYFPKNTTDRVEAEWISDDPSVAAIENGMIVAKGKGTTKVHAQVGPFDGTQDALTLTVTVKEYGVTFMGMDGKEWIHATGEYGQALKNLTVSGKDEIPWTLEDGDGTRFMGWYTGENGSGSAVTKDTILYEDIVLYPYFQTITEEEFFVKPIGNLTYTGANIKPEVQVYLGENLLKKGKDYTVSYQNNKQVNDGSDTDNMPTVLITGLGDYDGYSAKAYFTILPKSILHVDIKAPDLSVEYNGKVQKLRPDVTDGTRTLVNGVDYTLTYTDSADGAYKEAGTYTVKITGKGNYTGSRYAYITIAKRILMEEVSVRLDASVAFNNGKTYASETKIEECTPVPVLTYNATTLLAGRDYTLTYSNNKKIGTASIVIDGKGNYIGTKTVYFKITGTDIATTTVSGILDQEYTGEELKQAFIQVTDKKKNLLTEDLDYTVSYRDNVNTGKATVMITGKNGYTGSVEKTFTITPYDIEANSQIYGGNGQTGAKSAWEVQLLSDSVIYDKAGAGPDVTVTFKGEKLKEGTDYSLSYKNNQSVTGSGTEQKAQAVITGKGKFTGTVTKTYEITPGDFTAVSVTAEDVTFKNKKGYCFAEPVVKDVSGRRLTEGTDYSIVSYVYKEDTELTSGETRLAGTEAAQDDIPVADGNTTPSIIVTVKGMGNYTEETKSCTYKVLEDKGIFDKFVSGKTESSQISAQPEKNEVNEIPIDSSNNPEQTTQEAKDVTETTASQDNTDAALKKDKTATSTETVTKPENGKDTGSVPDGAVQSTEMQNTSGADGSYTISEEISGQENPEMNAQSMDGSAAEKKKTSKTTIAVAAVAGVAATATAVGGGVAAYAGVFKNPATPEKPKKGRKKKKKEDFFFDEEDEFLDD